MTGSLVQVGNTSSSFAPYNTAAQASTIAMRDASGGLTASAFNGAINSTGTSTVLVNTLIAATTLGNHNIVLCDATSAAFTVTLPPAAANDGVRYVIKRKNSGSNAVTVGISGSDTIDGASTYALSSQYNAVEVFSDGTEWWISATH